MLVLIAGVTAILLVGLVVFCFQMTRITGSYNEQRTSIEAAALAAAHDLSVIVFKDPNIGYVALSDAPPIGTNIGARDGYSVPVIGINTLLATVRVDMIIADLLNDSIMQQRALADYNNAANARNSLVAKLKTAVAGNGAIETDKDGNQLNPVADAITAYNQNVIRMAAQGRNNLVPNSMKLQLGCIPNSATTVSMTNTPIPMPAGSGFVNANQQQNGNYLAFINIPYKASNFVFAGLTGSTLLVDPLSFSTTCPGIPNQNLLIPSVVQCAADQIYHDKDEHGQPLNRTIHIVSCAQCENSPDPRPHPGALTVSFPNGVPTELTNILSLYYSGAPNGPHYVNWAPVDEFEMANNGGDYPEKSLTNNFVLPYWAADPNVQAPFSPQHPYATQAMSLAIYDWIRLGGATVNIQELQNFFNNSSFNQAPLTQAQIYFFEMTPIVNAQGVPTSQIVLTNNMLVPPAVAGAAPANQTVLSRQVSENQWLAISGAAIKSANGLYYDLDIKDNVYTPGPTAGGQHAGQPLGNQLPPNAVASAPGGSSGGALVPGLELDQPPPVGGEFAAPQGGGNAPRPTYTQMGQAVDIRFRQTGFTIPNQFNPPVVPL